MRKKTIAKIVGTIGAVFFLYGNATATTTACSSLVSGDVAPAVNCLYLNPPNNGTINDSVNPPSSTYTVNVEQFFGISTWQFDGKLETSPVSDTSSLLNFSGNNLGVSGSFTIAPNNYSNIMLVLKDGDTTPLIAYLLAAGTTGGTYTTPFTDPPFDLNGNSTTHNISHISVYYTNGDGTTNPQGNVPEPATLALMGLGLAGVALGRRGRRR